MRDQIAAIRVRARRSKKFVIGIAAAITLLAGTTALGGTPALADEGEGCPSDAEVVGSVMEGTPCSETIVASEKVTAIDGAGGNDVIVAGQEVLTINGGPGNDVIIGAPGTETIYAGIGDDEVYLDTSALPALYSSLPDPQKDCSPENLNEFSNVCFAGDKNQEVYAGDGDDTVFGERGNDQLHGESGRDRIYGSVGDDLLTGGSGDDILVGGNGSDNVMDNDGDDVVRGDTVGDVRDYGSAYPEGLNGGNGDDTISFASAITPGFRDVDIPNSGRFATEGGIYPNFPTSTEGRGVYVDLNEVVDGKTVTLATNGINKDGGGTDTVGFDFENIVGSPFADYLEGNGEPNTIEGGGGPDVIRGMGGGDFLFGGGESDHIEGGDQYDYANGESGTSVPGDQNYCLAEINDNCGRLTPGVKARSLNLIKVDTADEETHYLEGNGSISLLGSSGDDHIRAEYRGGERSLTFRSTGVEFDETQAQGCQFSEDNPNDATEDPNDNDFFAKCIIGTGGILDVVNIVGGGGSDDISIYDAGLPYTTSVFIQGGLGADTNLKGSDDTEDVIIDGPDLANDIIYGFGRSDSLYQGQGKDELYGGPDGDVLYASEVCEANTLDGGGQDDNITWAALPAPRKSDTDGVFANISGSIVGRNREGSEADCSLSGESFDTMNRIEHLEGSSGHDVLKGGPESNTLLGRAGADKLYGYGGDDFLHTHSGDYDLVIDCGSSGSAGDTLQRDRNRLDRRDDNFLGCESSNISEHDEEYEFAHDVNILSEKPAPVALYRLGEHFGTTAYVSAGRGKNSSSAYMGGYDLERPGGVPFSEDTAVWLNGSTNRSLAGYINLGNPTTVSGGVTYDYDAATYSGVGFSVSLWVKFNQGSSYPDSPQFQYIFSKMAGTSPSTKGFFMRRNSTGKIVFGTKRTAWTNAKTVESASAVSGSAWHHLVGTISGKTLTLYVDKNKTQNYDSSLTTSIFPEGANSSDFVLGKGSPAPSALPGTIDSLGIYPVALTDCQVRRHYDLGTTTDPVPGC